MLRKTKPLNPRSTEFQSRRQLKKFYENKREQYHQFNVFELKMSRLNKVHAFEQLVREMEMFNNELLRWKDETWQIKNFVMTYHLYQHLFERLRHVTSIFTPESSPEPEIKGIRSWFYSQKPKIRCQMKEPKAKILQKSQTNKIRSSSLPSDLISEEMQPFQKMSRTFHKGFLAPKESLQDYKRKQFIPFDVGKKEESFLKKNPSLSSMYKQKMSNYRNSITSITKSTFKQTKDSFKNTGFEFKLDGTKIIEQKKEPTENAQITEDKESEKKQEENKQQENVQQEKVDQVQEADLYEEEEEQEEEIEEKRQLKAYVSDHDQVDKLVAHDAGRVSYQAAIQKCKNMSEGKVQTKVEEIQVKRKMNQWAKTASTHHKKEFKKLEFQQKCNKYENIQHKKNFNLSSGFNKKIPAQEIPLLYRNKSSHTVTIEKQIGKVKFRETMKNWGKYINHGTSEYNEPQNQKQVEKMQKLKSTSLTNFSSQYKKPSFENIIQQNKPTVFNENLQDEIVNLKTSLAQKKVSIDKRNLYNGISALPKQKIQLNFKNQPNLLSCQETKNRR